MTTTGDMVKGPVHQPGVFNIEAFDGCRWRGGMNRIKRENAILTAKTWAATSGRRHRVFAPDGGLVFDTADSGCAAVVEGADGTIAELRYALAKQIPSASAIETDYGTIPLDSFMRADILRAVSEVFEARLALALAREGGDPNRREDAHA